LEHCRKGEERDAATQKEQKKGVRTAASKVTAA
jgi:hypothetical protein